MLAPKYLIPSCPSAPLGFHHVLCSQLPGGTMLLLRGTLHQAWRTVRLAYARLCSYLSLQSRNSAWRRILKRHRWKDHYNLILFHINNSKFSKIWDAALLCPKDYYYYYLFLLGRIFVLTREELATCFRCGLKYESLRPYSHCPRSCIIFAWRCTNGEYINRHSDTRNSFHIPV